MQTQTIFLADMREGFVGNQRTGVQSMINQENQAATRLETASHPPLAAAHIRLPTSLSRFDVSSPLFPRIRSSQDRFLFFSLFFRHSQAMLVSLFLKCTPHSTHKTSGAVPAHVSQSAGTSHAAVGSVLVACFERLLGAHHPKVSILPTVYCHYLSCISLNRPSISPPLTATNPTAVLFRLSPPKRPNLECS